MRLENLSFGTTKHACAFDIDDHPADAIAELTRAFGARAVPIILNQARKAIADAIDEWNDQERKRRADVDATVQRHPVPGTRYFTGDRIDCQHIGENGTIVGYEGEGTILVVDLDAGGTVHVPTADVVAIKTRRPPPQYATISDHRPS